MIAAPIKTLQSVFVDGGTRCLGHLIDRGKLGVEAFDAEDRSVGLFASRDDAADVLSKIGEPA